MQHAALPLPRRRLVGVALFTGLALGLAGSLQPGRATAATGCNVQSQSARVISLRVFEHGLTPARVAFFRAHKKARTRRAFVAGQRKRLAQLKRAVTRCSTSSTSGVPASNPDPEPPPCSPTLFSGPYTEMNEGTTNVRLPLQPEGQQIRAVMLFVDFSDLRSSESTSALYNRLVPRSQAWFKEVSYGRLQLAVTPVQRWVRMPRTLRDYGLADGISWREHHDYIADAIAAADSETDFSPYDVVYVVAAKGTGVERSPAFQAYPGDGIDADGRELRYGATFFEDTRSTASYAANVLIHETGHVLGLPDLYDVPNPTFWSLFRFTGGWDMMSWNDPGFHFLAWEKWKLGWLEPSQLTCLEGPGEVTTTLTPIERAGGLKAVVVPMGVSSAYVIEARRSIGQDSRLCDVGVLVYWVDAAVRSGYGPVRIRPAQSDTNRELHDRCGPLYNAPFDSSRGEVAHFEDNPAGLSMRVLSSNGNGYRVRVTRSSLAPQRVPTGPLGEGGGSSLAPPRVPLSALSFPFGIGWDLSGPPTAD